MKFIDIDFVNHYFIHFLESIEVAQILKNGYLLSDL